MHPLNLLSDFQDLRHFKLYSRVDLQSMLAYLDCDPVDTRTPDSRVPINPLLPDWSKSSRPLDQVLKGGGTNVRVLGTRTGDRRRGQDNSLPQAGLLL